MGHLLNMISDIYCEKDLLGFEPYIDTLNRMISDKGFKTPFCIGIFGKWGSGKTSFMRLLEKRLLTHKNKPHSIPVWFNPWRYEKEEHLIIPFLKTMEQEIRGYIGEHKGIGQTLSEKLKLAAIKIGEASAAFAYGIKADCKLGGFGFTLDPSKMISREEKLASERIEEARGLSEKLSSIYYEIVDEMKSAVDEKSFRIVAFIDDLDRCLPDKAVELLESIKLFLDIEGYLFVIGVDRDVVRKGVSYHYRFFEHRNEKEQESLIISPEDYLEKMVQLPLELPTIEHGRKRKFIESLLSNAEELKKHSDIIEIGVGDNPRALKRFINVLAFTVMLAETLKENILNDKVTPIESDEHKEDLRKHFIPLLYIKWTIIVFCYPKVHSDIKGNRRRLIELQEAARGRESAGEVDEEKAEKKGFVEIDERLRKVLIKGAQFPDNAWLIDRFIYLSESTVLSEQYRDDTRGYRKHYKQGDMVLIPKGKFLFGDENMEKEVDHDYYIDVFPVTNKQYREFIDETDYDVPHIEEDSAKPYNWNKDDRTYPKGIEDHPVVLVSHEDAETFCKWRSKKEGNEIRLPTEEEWEKAARGEDGRKYPWGDEFDFKRLNCADYHLQKVLKDSDEWRKEFREGFYKKNKDKALTSDVGRFETGVSPFSCHDMAGDVWEWTGSFYDKDKDTFVLRGGSWYLGGLNCRCANRLRLNPYYRFNNVGFRCARTLTL